MTLPFNHVTTQLFQVTLLGHRPNSSPTYSQDDRLKRKTSSGQR